MAPGTPAGPEAKKPGFITDYFQRKCLRPKPVDANPPPADGPEKAGPT
ncbi:MAG: hypothetical protein V1809_15990 [Planctomycetota bacterium]